VIGVALLFAAKAAQPANLTPLKPFLGACWRTDFSASTHDTHCFETMYGGAHVRDRHEVQQDGKTVYAGETIYSADGADLVFTYFNSLGGVGRGTARKIAGQLRFVGQMRGSAGDPLQPIDSAWRFIDADHYEVRSLVPVKRGQANPPRIFTRVAARPGK
jgi:hypothetical protein